MSRKVRQCLEKLLLQRGGDYSLFGNPMFASDALLLGSGQSPPTLCGSLSCSNLATAANRDKRQFSDWSGFGRRPVASRYRHSPADLHGSHSIASLLERAPCWAPPFGFHVVLQGSKVTHKASFIDNLCLAQQAFGSPWHRANSDTTKVHRRAALQNTYLASSRQHGARKPQSDPPQKGGFVVGTGP